MIKNYLQYEYSKEWAKKFDETNRKLHANEEKRLKDPEGWQLLQDSNEALRQSLLDEISEYEILVAHNPNEPITLTANSMNKLSDLLIKARIAFKITSDELAALRDRTKQQIKSFEDKDYQNASFLDFLAVSDALGIKILEGRFVAELDDFYKEHLAAVRQTENVNTTFKAAS
ncbi:hypothetical protein [Iningainema tapete]|uniref:Uncharacterized protein n=1 Tax=Iningainema tapete BLCC-T55 TaxID=2748662 RepID=A0A8J7C7K9_9CYAN|nr:hypothetical protein [Iningainema tapete]MBD2775754.1 hypothetical protein [Iningainema tapete BLCC-T55]